LHTERRDVVIALRKPRAIGVPGIAVVAALCLRGNDELPNQRLGLNE
jgi:hypothetical protein